MNDARYRPEIVSLLILTLSVYLLSGCAATWSRITLPEMKGPGNRYTVKVPSDWIHAAFIQQGICISKDGPNLNWIDVRHVGKKTAFNTIGAEIKDTQLVTEVAEYYLAHFKKTHPDGAVNLIALSPARISGRSGFRMRLETRDNRGMIDDYLIYGVTDDDYFYRLLYRAPRLHYFERDLAVYEALVASFQINPKP